MKVEERGKAKKKEKKDKATRKTVKRLKHKVDEINAKRSKTVGRADSDKILIKIFMKEKKIFLIWIFNLISQIKN